MNENKDKIFAEALIRILKNQIEIKAHLGLVKETGYYGDCFYDNQVIYDLENIE